MIPKAYTKKQTAELLGLCTKSIERLIKDGKLDSTFVGKRRMFLDYHIENCLRRNETINYN